MQNTKLSNLDQDNLYEFVILFGSFIMFVFIEATTRNNEALITNWVENAIPLKLMFNYFIFTFTDELTLKEKIRNKTSLYEFNEEKRVIRSIKNNQSKSIQIINGN